MKKKLFAIIAVIMSIMIGVSSLFGCNLVTPNNERDLKQVVATVNIGNEGQATDEILKKDMIMAYLNYGYSYVYQGEMTSADAFKMIVDNLINASIMTQYVKKYYEENALIKDSAKAKWDVERYITADEKLDATYDSVEALNKLIDAYEEDEEVKKQDTVPSTERNAPVNAEKAEKELTPAEKQQYITDGVIKGDVGSNRRKAYNEAVKVLDDNMLLGDDFANDDLTTSLYYKDTLTNAEESILIQNYRNIVADNARAPITFDELKNQYKLIYEEQKTKHASAMNFADALTDINALGPLVYSQHKGYGFVYNLLLGVSKDQEAEIKAIEEKDTIKRSAERRTILSSTIAKDLRTSWILSGYDFDGVNFTGDYTLVPDSPYAFQGVAEVKNAGEDDEFRSIKSVREFGLDEFINEINNYIYGSSVGAYVNDSAKPEVLYSADVASQPANYHEKINELIFAFSTDSGSLNTYRGYVIAPTPDLDGEETYMKEFANAGRELLKMGEGSYMVVATDYGYHFMFYSMLLDETINYPTFVDYLNSCGSVQDEAYWLGRYNDILANYNDEDYVDALGEADLYIYNLIKTCANADTAVEADSEAIIRTYKFDKNYVVKYESRYTDLLGL